MASAPKLSPTQLGSKIASEGPHKQEPTNRRLRGLLNGKWIFDTLLARYVWEHPLYPMMYIQEEDVRKGDGDIERDEQHEGFWLGKIMVDGESVPITCFEKGALAGYFKIGPGSMDWFAEDQRLLGPHAKDPYKRIEILPSSRTIRIEVRGTIIAESSNNMFLHETLLRARYYLSPTSVKDWRMLVPSETTTFCPYKGMAKFYDLQIGKEVIKDAVWFYEYPLAESQQIQGLLSFYNEKVDVFIDGVLEESDDVGS